jgi:hypothetical protein
LEKAEDQRLAQIKALKDHKKESSKIERWKENGLQRR